MVQMQFNDLAMTLQITKKLGAIATEVSL